LTYSGFDVGVLFAIGLEFRAFVSALKRKATHFELKKGCAFATAESTKVVAIVCGIGWERAERAAKHLAEQDVRTIVSAGIAGALDPKLEVADLVVARHVTAEPQTGFNPITCDGFLCLPNLRLSQNDRPIYYGDILTCRSLVCTREDKRRLFETTCAQAVDMESYAIGRVCKERDVRFCAVKAISDTAEQNLPQIISECGALNTQMKYILRRPMTCLELTKLCVQARCAAKKLAEFLVSTFFTEYREVQGRL